MVASIVLLRIIFFDYHGFGPFFADWVKAVEHIINCSVLGVIIIAFFFHFNKSDDIHLAPSVKTLKSLGFLYVLIKILGVYFINFHLNILFM